MEDIMIKFEHVSKEYRLGVFGRGTLKADLQSWWAYIRKLHTNNRRFLALDDISFSVLRGETLGIIGHNGAGKTTLLKLLSRITAPTQGRICFNGRVSSILEVGTGFHPELTGRENIYLNGAILGMTKAEVDRHFDSIVEFAELAQFIDTPIKRYSSGMSLKLAFAVAAHLNNEIMVLDEVFAVGDVKFQQKCFNKMGDITRQDAKTILYVSHNMQTVREMCERCIVLNNGRLVFEGPTEEAIPYYLKSMDEELKTDIDLSDKSMPHFRHQSRAKLMRITLDGKTQAIYSSGETMYFRMQVKANGEIENLSARFEFRFADGVPIGTALSRPLGRLSAGESKSYTLEFSPPKFVNGRYKVVLNIYACNRFGVFEDFDGVDPAFWFEIRDNNGIIWNKRNWGHIKFDDIESREEIGNNAQGVLAVRNMGPWGY